MRQPAPDGTRSRGHAIPDQVEDFAATYARLTPFAHRVTIAIVVPLLACACARKDSAADFEITAAYVHDGAAYTQGLVADDSVLFESTGRYGGSDLRRVNLRTGTVLARHTLAANEFGEGLALHERRLYQLTWKEGRAYVYDAATLTPLDTLRYEGEGWGLASDGQRLYMSDGSDSLRVLVPGSFTVERVLRVTHRGAPLSQLNELEFFEGTLLANVYESNWVAQIDPTSGRVLRMLDFADLYLRRPPGVEVMNGIAVSPDGTQLLLTGKLWPKLFQVRIRRAQEP